MTEGNIDPIDPKIDAAPSPVCRDVPVDDVDTAGAFADAAEPLVTVVATL